MHVFLASIRVPALVIGARYDTMDPAHMKMTADRLPTGATCTAHTAATYDDQAVYFTGLIDFLHGIAGHGCP